MVRQRQRQPPSKFNTLGSQFYEVEKISGMRHKRGSIEYLIKWKGYTHKESTWEPQKNLVRVQELIQEYKLRVLMGLNKIKTRSGGKSRTPSPPPPTCEDSSIIEGPQFKLENSVHIEQLQLIVPRDKDELLTPLEEVEKKRPEVVKVINLAEDGDYFVELTNGESLKLSRQEMRARSPGLCIQFLESHILFVCEDKEPQLS